MARHLICWSQTIQMLLFRSAQDMPVSFTLTATLATSGMALVPGCSIRGANDDESRVFVFALCNWNVYSCRLDAFKNSQVAGACYLAALGVTPRTSWKYRVTLALFG